MKTIIHSHKKTESKCFDKLAIVVIAYSRPNELLELLKELVSSSFKGPTDLLVSVDFGPSQLQIKEIIESFNWPHGNKLLTLQASNLGLRNHVLAACDSGSAYSKFCVLEEDLVVSPAIGEFIEAIIKKPPPMFLAGYGLYSYERSEKDKLPFRKAIKDNNFDLIQIACSWGQLWFSEQWKDFRLWLDTSDVELKCKELLPSYIASWPESSWKKLFTCYMIDTGKYFLYPKWGVTTNPGVSGENHSSILNLYKTPIRYSGPFCETPDSIKDMMRYNSSFVCEEKLPLSYRQTYFKKNISSHLKFFSINSFSTIFYLRVLTLAIKNDLNKLIYRIRKWFEYRM